MALQRFRLRAWEWVHPSHRDLVIDQLSSSAEMSEHYLKHGGISALSLALSQGGGASGQRVFPLLVSKRSWEVLTEACVATFQENPAKNVGSILTILESATSTSVTAEVRRLVLSVCSAVRDHWDRENIALPIEPILRLIKLSERTGHYLRSPSLQTSWELACKKMKAEAREAAESPGSLSIESLENWSLFVRVIDSTEPKLMPKNKVESRFDDSIEQYVQAFQTLLETEYSDDDPEEYQSESERSNAIADIIEDLIEFFPSRASGLTVQAAKFHVRCDSLSEEAEELKQELGLVDADEEREDYQRGESLFDLESLFQDL